MFAELMKLRELSRLLRMERFEEVLAAAGDPRIRGHRRAREAAESARRALLDRARSRLERGEPLQARDDVQRLLDSDPGDDAARRLEEELQRALKTRDAEARRRAAARMQARRLSSRGELTMAAERLQGSGEPGEETSGLARDVERRREARDRLRRDLEEALEAGRPQAAGEAFRALIRDSSVAHKAGEDGARVLGAFVERGSAGEAAEMLLAAREAGLVLPAGSCDPAARLLVEAAGRKLRAGVPEEARRLLEPFPLESPSDARAQELLQGLEDLQAAGRLLEEGELELAEELARNAEEVCGVPQAGRLAQQATQARKRCAEVLEEARGLLGSGQVLRAREVLVACMGQEPCARGLRTLFEAVERRDKRDAESLARARSSLERGAPGEALSVLVELVARRPDLPEAPGLLLDAERRIREARRREIRAELAAARRPAPRDRWPEPVEIPPGRPFVLRVEERGDWMAHPGRDLVIGNRMGGQADLPVLAAIGTRHARLMRSPGPGSGVRYQVEPLAGKSVRRNQRPLRRAEELHDGDVLDLGGVVTARFYRPVPDNHTAVLELEGDFTVHGCSRVLLLAESGDAGAVVIGPGPAAHVSLGPDRDRLELLREDDGPLVARCPYGVALDGDELRPQVRVRAGVRLHTMDVDLFVDPVP